MEIQDKSDFQFCSIVQQCCNYFLGDNHYDESPFYNHRFLSDNTTTILDDSNDDEPIDLNAVLTPSDATWILTSSFVIFTMQTGFGLLETGCSKKGFAVNILMKNVIDVVFGAVSYYAVGYGFSFGSPSNGFMGLGDFAPHSFDAHLDEASDLDTTGSGALFARYIFQLSFAATSTTIVSGCVAMRMKFFIYCAYAFFAVIPYSICAHWVFDENGWLAQRGVLDFAGGSAVHLLGAMNGLVAILLLGPRTGRFDPSISPREFDPVTPTDSLFGLFMLWWGWIGFNCGSSFGILGNRWIIATRAAITTINSSAAGGIAGCAYSMVRTRGKHIKIDHVVNAILGGLVAITPVCAAVRVYDAFIIGALGALAALILNDFVYYCRLDDPVGALGVHAGAATLGLLSGGLFADASLPGSHGESGLFYGGSAHLLGIQCLTIISVTIWSFCTSGPFFYIVGVVLNGFDFTNPRAGLRISKREERTGADLHLHGLGDVKSIYGDSIYGNDDNHDDDDDSDNDDDDDVSSDEENEYESAIHLSHRSLSERDQIYYHEETVRKSPIPSWKKSPIFHHKKKSPIPNFRNNKLSLPTTINTSETTAATSTMSATHHSNRNRNHNRNVNTINDSTEVKRVDLAGNVVSQQREPSITLSFEEKEELEAQQQQQEQLLLQSKNDYALIVTVLAQELTHEQIVNILASVQRQEEELQKQFHA